MTVFLTLDYELFLLQPAENIEKSLLQPTLRLHNLFKKHAVRAVYFVDAGYLFALDRQRKQFEKLNYDWERVTQQIRFLVREGNDIGLHIHPHWEDSYYNGNAWKMDITRYRLADFSAVEAAQVFKKYYQILKSVVSSKIIAYRAGGWCLEPFHQIREAMMECGIYIDSTVFYGGYQNNNTHVFDFTKYPDKDLWRFNTDPSEEHEHGWFLEVPITSCRLSPFLFWKGLISKFNKSAPANNGGLSVTSSFSRSVGKLFFRSTHALTMDSFKASTLLQVYKKHKQAGKHFLCIIGHPKCFTESTFLHLEEFISYVKKEEDKFATFSKTFQAPVPPVEITG